MTDGKSREIESLIALSAKLKEAIQSALECYNSLPPILEQELKAIRSGKIADAESVLYTKESLVTEIEKSYEKMASVSDEIWKKSAKKMQSITELVDYFSLVSSENSLAEQVLEHQSKSLKAVSLALIEAARKAKPLIEANKLLVTKFQENYNQSYKFWQEIKEDVEGSYSPDGSKKILGRHHGFSARA